MNFRLFFALLLMSANFSVSAETKMPEPSHNIEYPTGWQNWANIAVSHRTDNNTLRLIIGNNIAVKAARAGKTNPWPEGAIIGKVVWEESSLENWPSAIVPKQLVHSEFMFKDSKKYSKTHGWGWARWIGLEQKAFNKGTEVCSSCHKAVRKHNWVFTEPAQFPEI